MGQPGWCGVIPGPAVLLSLSLGLDPSGMCCRSHFWSVVLIPGCLGKGGMSPKPSGFLRSGTECPCHGKTPWEELWQLPAAPALAVITPWLLPSLRGRDELPQLLGDVTEGPGILQGGFQAWGPPGMGPHMPEPSSLSQHGICWVTGGSTQIRFPWEGKSVGSRVLPGKPRN